MRVSAEISKLVTNGSLTSIQKSNKTSGTPPRGTTARVGGRLDALRYTPVPKLACPVDRANIPLASGYNAPPLERCPTGR